MKFIFWLSLIVLCYTYFGYPGYIYLRARSKKSASAHKCISYKPFVSVVFSAYNEEAMIERKLNNLLESQYPADKLEILVGSDGSDDGTNKILSRIADKRVHTFIFNKRRGKISVINDMAPKAKGEILVFCDARQLFDKNAISNLAANFKDERIGCVSGTLVFETGKNRGVSEGIGAYWKYETFIRRYESAVHSMIGAAGAIYAVRKKLYSSPPANTILDDVYIPLAIARRGYRCIVDETAIAYDKPACAPGVEFGRKARTLAGNYQIFGMFKDLLVPFRNPVSMPLISHKLLRVLAPFFMIVLFMSNLFLAASNTFYAALLIGQILFYILAMTKLSAAAYMFCIMNFAALAGLYRFLFGKQEVAWEK